jgi:tetratricopeptide (TPR) repeat protein
MSDSQPASANRAVFLSYASQDAEVVERIAEALRTAGVEVWFDKNELVGGDAWDAKIRGQIGSCALFVPVISAATQARGEGYFRLEWKLAVDRSHLMAHDQPFLLPVVIDATPDASARVPAEFRAVQWTRLPGGETPERFCGRVMKLLGAESAAQASRPAGPAVGASLDGARGRRKFSPRQTTIRSWLIPALVGATVIVALAIWQPWKNWRAVSAAPTEKTSSSTGQPLLDRMAAIYEKGYDATTEELALGMELGAQAVALDNLSAESWAAYAQMTALAYVCGVKTPELYAQALTRAQRAVSLAGNSFEARFALASVYTWNGVTTKEGKSMLRQLVAERPTDGRVLVRLAAVLDDDGQYQEALTIVDRALAVSARDVAAWNQRATTLHRLGRIAEALAAVDKSLAIRLGARALMEKAYIQVFLEDDYPAAAAVLAQLPGSVLTRDLETLAYGEFWLTDRQPEKALATFAAFPGDTVRGDPKACYTGVAFAMLGRGDAARVEWTAALKQIDARLAAKSNDADGLLWKALLLARLGEQAEAGRTLETARQFARPAELRVAKTLATLGQREAAISDLIERWPKTPDFYNAVALRNFILHDPDFDPLREDPRFQAFVRQIREDPRFPIPRKASGPP